MVCLDSRSAKNKWYRTNLCGPLKVEWKCLPGKASNSSSGSNLGTMRGSQVLLEARCQFRVLAGPTIWWVLLLDYIYNIIWEISIYKSSIWNYLCPRTLSAVYVCILRCLKGVSSHIDDVLVFRKTIEEHNENIWLSLTKFSEANLTLNMEKCKFLQRRINFLGHIIDGSGIRPDQDKVKALQKCHLLPIQQKFFDFWGWPISLEFFCSI